MLCIYIFSSLPIGIISIPYLLFLLFLLVKMKIISLFNTCIFLAFFLVLFQIVTCILLFLFVVCSSLINNYYCFSVFEMKRNNKILSSCWNIFLFLVRSNDNFKTFVFFFMTILFSPHYYYYNRKKLNIELNWKSKELMFFLNIVYNIISFSRKEIMSH